MDRVQIFCMRATWLALCFAMQVAGARADESLNQYLNSNYRDKTFFIRGFYKDNHLKYSSAGKPTGNANSGYWTVDGGVQIRKIKVSDSRLRVRAERLFLDLEAGQAMVFRRGEQWVDLDAELDPQHVQTADVDVLLAKIFLTGHDNLLDLVPDYWKPCLAAALAGSTSKDLGCHFRSSVDIPLSSERSAAPGSFAADEQESPTGADNGEVIHRAREKGIVPPHPTRSPDAEFSEQARSLHAAGIVTLTLMVDQSGHTRRVRIVRPRGLGLDERAVEKVKTWEFVPASKDGKPVNVEIAVEMDFHYQ